MAILNAGTTNPAVSGYPYDNSMLSFFGRVSLDYDSKYLIAANLRRDGSSKFADGHKWGTFRPYQLHGVFPVSRLWNLLATG